MPTYRWLNDDSMLRSFPIDISVRLSFVPKLYQTRRKAGAMAFSTNRVQISKVLDTTVCKSCPD
eukprot:2952124-Amphidinium_carterae.1